MNIRMKCLLGLLALALLLAGCGPERYYNKGNERFNEGNYDKAIEEYRKAIEKDDDGEFPDAADKVVECYLKKAEQHYDTNIHNAVTECQSAVAEAKRLNVRPDTLQRAESALADTTAERDRRVAEAARLLAEARKIVAETCELGDYQRAQSNLEQALKLDPRNSEVSVELANIRRTIADINRANALAAQGDALIAVDSSLTLKGIENARSYYKQALQTFPRCSKAQAGLGRIDALIAKVKARAVSEYQAALTFQKDRKWQSSLDKLNECIRLDYTHSAALALKPKISALVLAEREYNSLVSQVEARRTAGIGSVEVADELVAMCDKAIKTYEYNEKAVSLKKAVLSERTSLLRRAEEYFIQGKMQLAQKKYEDAQTSFRKCLEIYNNHTEASTKLLEVNTIIENLARARVYARQGDEYMKQGKPYEAKEAYENALGLVKDLPEAEAGLKSAEEMIVRYVAEAKAAAQEAETSYRRSEYEDALKKIDEAILKDPNNRTYTARRKIFVNALAEQHYKIGQQYETAKDWDRAADEYKQAESYDEKYKTDYERVVNEKAADRHVDEAEDTHIPDKDWYNAARSYQKAADLSTSRKSDFRELRDEMLDKMMAQAADYEKEGEYEDAIETLDKVVEINSSYKDAGSRADVLRRSLTKAETAYSNAIGVHPREEVRRRQRRTQTAGGPSAEITRTPARSPTRPKSATRPHRTPTTAAKGSRPRTRFTIWR